MRNQLCPRRDFLTSLAGAAGAALVARSASGAEPAAGAAGATKPPLWQRLPRWRGFNLLEKFQKAQNAPFREEDFSILAEWGFDFVRLPMDYRCWTDPNDPYRLDEKVLEEIDQAVAFGRAHKVHVDLNLHRAPGYTVAQPPEKRDLWSDEEPQKQFDFQWSTFSKRYRGIPPAQLSFDLVNEPANTTPAAYAKVCRRVVEGIRREDPERLVIADGLQWGREPVFQLVDLKIAQSTRGYEPMQISHYEASWVNSKGWARPTWPLKVGTRTMDRETLRAERIEPWRKLAAAGAGVHVGECGAYNKTPHDVFLGWLEDCLSLWKEAGWGWALWNLRGSFGVLDSERADVAYEEFKGHKLDRKLMELLRRY